MKILIIDNATRHLDRLKEWLGDGDIAVRPFGDVSVEDCASFDLVVLSGGSLMSVVGHEKEYASEIDVIRHANKPILGICLGFELIAHAFGGTLAKMGEKRRGDMTIALVAGDPLTAGIDALTVREAHRWVVSDAGAELNVLGRSPDGIEIVRHKEKPIFGFQFHPEFTVDERERTLFKNALRIVAERAKESAE